MAARSRLLEIAGILLRHGAARGVTPDSLVEILEELGPTFVKLGQVLSMRPDMLPEPYCQALSRLRSDVSPMPFEEVERAVELSLGLPLSEAFLEFSPEPLGAASLAQAHAATLADGREVVVKVQRPEIYSTMERDVALLRKAAGLLSLARPRSLEVLDLGHVLDELWAVTRQELDFLQEAQNAEEFARLNLRVRSIGCPEILRPYTTDKLLTMERIDGVALTDREALEAAGYDIREIAEKLAASYVRQVVELGFFHADPHPGNLLVREGKIIWLDFGMMGRLCPRDQELIRRAARAVAHRDVGALEDVALSLGEPLSAIDHAALYADLDDLLNRYAELDMGSMDLSLLLRRFFDLAARHRIRLPANLSMLARGIATLQGVLKILCPEISLAEILRRYAISAAGTNWRREVDRALRSLRDSASKSVELPSQLSDALSMLMKGRLRVSVEHSPSASASENLARAAARLVEAMLAACLAIVSALLCLGDLPRPILGLPAASAIGFAISLLWAASLLVRTRRAASRRPPRGH